jgi:ParB-like chromosome segregation protein Spo0J
MDFHPTADLFPLMSDDAFEDLCADISANGLREAIWVFGEKIVDGRNRYNACVRLGIEPRYQAYQGDEAALVSFCVSLNLKRRHLSESQRAMVAQKLTSMNRGYNPSIDGLVSQTDASKLLNVSVESISRAAKIHRDGVPELAEKVESGELTVFAAAKIANLPKTKQKRLIRKGRKAAQKLLSSLKTASLKKAVSTGCLLCDPQAVATRETISAAMQQLAYRFPAYSSYFNDIVEELEGMELSDETVAAETRVLAAIDQGYCEKQQILDITGIPRDLLDHTIANMIDYRTIEVLKECKKTDKARGATKTIYRRAERPDVPELHYELDTAEEFADAF